MPLDPKKNLLLRIGELLAPYATLSHHRNEVVEDTQDILSFYVSSKWGGLLLTTLPLMLAPKW